MQTSKSSQPDPIKDCINSGDQEKLLEIETRFQQINITNYCEHIRKKRVELQKSRFLTRCGKGKEF